jgi:hypothetical protein
MKKEILFLLFFTILNGAYAQRVSYKEKEDLSLYTLALNELKFKSQPIDLPNYSMINGSYLSYFKEFIEDKFTSPGLKNYMLKDEWAFLQDIDVNRYSKRSEKMNVSNFRELLRSGFKFRNDLNYSYNVSPVIYDKDCKRAALILQRSGNSEVLDVQVFFFTKENQKWKISRVQIPYLI